MQFRNSLQRFYLSYFSRPKSDRVIYRAIRQQGARRIVEVGIGTAQRAVRMLEMAGLCSPDESIHYTGLDQFESRRCSDGPGVNLKLAHRMLGATGARVRLLPGEPLALLPAAANASGAADLLIFSARLDPRELARSWFFVPRLLHEGTQVFVEGLLPGGRVVTRRIAHDEIRSLAAVRRRAA